MQIEERLLQKVLPVKILPACLREIQNSPIKIVKSYLEELKTRKNSLNHDLPPVNILDKRCRNQSSLKFLINVKQTHNKVIQDYPLQYNQHPKREASFELRDSTSNSFSALPSISSNPMESLNRDISVRKKELSRNYSNEKVNAKLSLYYRKLTRIRSQYQHELIVKCRKLSKYTSQYREYGKS